MVAVTFGTLKTRCLNELNKTSSVYDTLLGDTIVTAIRHYELSRFWFLEKSGTLTLLSTASSVALPNDFKSLINLRLLRNGLYYGPNQGFKGLSYEELQSLIVNSTATGYPQIYALFANSVYVDQVADQNYTLAIDYVKGDATYPSNSGDTSVWFDDGVDLVRSKALALFWRDVLHDEERAEFYERQAGNFYTMLQSRHNNREYSYRLK